MSQRKSWSKEEDLFITEKVRLNQKLPDKERLKWGDIADQLNTKFTDCNRSGKQCRQRWHNQLDPNISKNQWTVEEQKKLFDLQKKLGNKWAIIASHLKGRTDNNVKNYFYSTLRKSLRKLNSFISLHRLELKSAKQFKQSSLSKLLAVADHKFDKKINVKKSSAQQEAIQIKNLLIQVTGHQITNAGSKNVFSTLVKKLQEWNKCCKKKKGKRKQQEDEMEVIQQEVNSDPQEQDQNQKDSQIDEQQDAVQKTQSKKTIITKTIKRQAQDRSRSRNKSTLNKKRSNISRKSAKQNQQKPKTKNQQNNKKLQKKPSKLEKKPSIPQFTRRVSSRHQQNSPNHQNFIDLARSSLDLGKYQRKNSFGEGSQLFKSFVVNENIDEQHIEKKKGFTSRVSRSNSNMSFFNMIKQVSLVNNESRNQDMRDILQQEDEFDPFYLNMLKKESSKRDIPLLRDESNFWNIHGLDQSLRFEPQISKLRSYKKQSANFELEYKFGDGK